MKFKLLLVGLVIAGIFVYSLALGLSFPKLFSFDKKDSLKEWKEKVFKGKVLYQVKVEKGNGYLDAYSRESASGMFYRTDLNPKKYPFVSWKWKVSKFPDKKIIASGENGWIEKDDYAARFYVIFPSFIITATKAIEYVWDKNLPEGKLMTSPYFKNIKIFVVTSGENKKNQWVSVERNIADDYRKAFNRGPTGVGAIAVMTDTDNTLSTAEAEYDEIKVGYKK